MEFFVLLTRLQTEAKKIIVKSADSCYKEWKKNSDSESQRVAQHNFSYWLKITQLNQQQDSCARYKYLSHTTCNMKNVFNSPAALFMNCYSLKHAELYSFSSLMIFIALQDIKAAHKHFALEQKQSSFRPWKSFLVRMKVLRNRLL